MQLKFGRDFFIRPARGSDRNEVIALIEKEGSSPVAVRVGEDFLGFLNRPELYFRVILNSNGIMIGAIVIEKNKLEALAINPNFLRRELRDEVKNQLSDWAIPHANRLVVAREIIAGDWKSYFKQNAVKIEPEVPGFESLDFGA
jgi:hypothetical protein